MTAFSGVDLLFLLFAMSTDTIWGRLTCSHGLLWYLKILKCNS